MVMRQSRKNRRAIPANDDVKLGVEYPVAHVYVPNAGAETTGKECAPHVYVPESRAKACSPHVGHIPKNGAHQVWAPTLITTNLPEILPILPEEIVLIGGTMADLVNRILANDNESI